MNEKPKSIWKKSCQLPRTPLIWFALLLYLVLAMVIVEIATDDSWKLPVKLIVAVTGASIGLGLWKFFRWLCCWRNARRFAFGVVCFITLIALLYAEEDFRGKRAWNNFKREWEAKGEKFDFASFVPPPVPDDQNFAMTPVLRPILDYYKTPNGIRWHDTNGYARLETLSVHAPDI